MAISKQHVDPRKDISHEINSGQVYKDVRNSTKVTLVYLDDEHALLKDGDGHALLTPRKNFEKNVGAGRYKVQGEVTQTSSEAHTPVEFETIDGVGSVAATSLRTSGFSSVEDINRANNDELLACRGIGEGNLENIRERVEQL